MAFSILERQNIDTVVVHYEKALRDSKGLSLMDEHLEPRLRILLGSAIAIGPGKAALLEAIGETGSIAAAGRRMGMSYRRAWFLVKTMNSCFKEPLVDASKGGAQGGGARLTSMGQDVLKRYKSMEALATEAVASELRSFMALMTEPSEEV